MTATVGLIASGVAGAATPASAALVGSDTTPPAAGYWLGATDGGVFSFGTSFLGSLSVNSQSDPVVGIANTLAPSTGGVPGYDLATRDGVVYSCDGTCGQGGVTGYHGSLASPPSSPIVGIAPVSQGYWLAGAGGSVYGFDTSTFGSEAGKKLNQPIVGIAATPSGGGYWLVAADGGVFAFGNAKFYGSEGGKPLNQPIVGIAATPSGGGYWLVAADGGVFTFGNAQFHGSEGGKPLNQPVVGMSATASGNGYLMTAKDGGVFTFGDAHFFGSQSGKPLEGSVVGLTQSCADPSVTGCS